MTSKAAAYNGFAELADAGEIAVELRQMNTKLPAGTLGKLWADPTNWRADIIYVCKDDPRLIVPKRRKWGGWTINIAHASAWVLLLVVVLSAAIPATCFAEARMLSGWGWIAFSVGFIVFACALSAILSWPKWYECAG